MNYDALRKVGCQILDCIYGEEDRWALFVTRLSNGEPLPSILKGFQITWGAWNYWRKDHQEAEQDVNDARQSYAETAVFEARDLADKATSKNVAVAKLKGDRRWQIAEKIDRQTWGSKENTGGNGVTINLVQFTEADVMQGRVIDAKPNVLTVKT